MTPPRAAIALAIAFVTVGLLRSAGLPSVGITFTDVAASAGLIVPSIYGGVDRKRFIIETNGAGTAWIDADQDGWLDALVLGGTRLIDGQRADDPAIAAAGSTTRLYRNQRDGTFKDITAASGLGLTVWASSVCGGDYDNDGRLDLFITSFGRNRLFRALGSGRFEDVTAAQGLPADGRRAGAPAAHSSTSIGTAGSISSSRTTWSSISPPRPSRDRASIASGRAFPSIAGRRGCPPTRTSCTGILAHGSRMSPGLRASQA